MKITIAHPYLVFPVNRAKSCKKMRFFVDDALVYEMDIRLDYHSKDFYAYLDMRRFMGQTLECTVEPDMEPFHWTADAIDRDDVYEEPFRPLYHFTEMNGWHNDPNGLVKVGDTWHMFYQLNPAEPQWGNMHWGHAISTDLFHWTQLETALFPDDLGTMFSGSGIIDTENRAGFGKDAVLFFYTAAGGSGRAEGQKFTQCLAYSTDGGMTLTKYEGNPIIPHIIGGNRDPKVIFCEEMNTYLCALYLDGNTYALLSSDDFLHWTLIQKLDLPGDAECPDFYPLTADDGVRKWVFSGANAKYLVGDMVNGQFVPTQPVRSMHTGSLGYAAQTYSTLPDGRRINIAWDRVNFPGNAPFCSQMGIPVTHVLRRDEDGYYVHASPVKEAKKLRGSGFAQEHVVEGIACTVSDAANELLLTVAAAGEDVTLQMLGFTLVLDRQKMEVRLGEDWRMPVCPVNGRIKLRLFTDTCSLELFSEKYSACFPIVADENLPKVTLCGEKNADLSVWPLSGVWHPGHIHAKKS